MEVNPSMIQEDFGLHLKTIRRHNKLTQEQIAKKLNISRQAYSNYKQLSQTHILSPPQYKKTPRASGDTRDDPFLYRETPCMPYGKYMSLAI